MRELLPFFQKPSRYAGCEYGIPKKNKASASIRIALAFPDLYEVGMSYAGQKILYNIINRNPRFMAERVYAPAPDASLVMQERGVPLATLETDTPLEQMDAIAFSVTHELCYTNILYMLDLAGIPLREKDRPQAFPLVMAGGGCAFNPEPMAAFLDLIVVGDGEEVLPEILDFLDTAKKEGLGKREILLKLKDLPGVYVPSFFADTGPFLPPKPLLEGYERIERRLVGDLNEIPYPSLQPLPFGNTVHNRLTLEIARGCTRGCRFCQAGMIYRPLRERKPETVLRMLKNGLGATGFEEVSFLSLSSGDYSYLTELIRDSFDMCSANRTALSMPSLRVGSISEEVMTLIAGIRRTGVTIAPEAGSRRLRDVINKGITEEELLEHVTTLFKLGWQQVKLYFMIGLPTETMEDLDAIIDLCRKVERAAGPKAKRLQITCSVSTFVPKPHTPFEREAQIPLDETIRRIDYIKTISRPFRRIKLRWHSPQTSYLEGVFARGDRCLADAVETAFKKGALFSDWEEHLRFDLWMQSFEETGINPDEYLGARDDDAPLPWAHINSGISGEFLKAERNKARRGIITQDCRFGQCSGCGMCNFSGHKSNLSLQARKMEIKPVISAGFPQPKDLRPGDEAAGSPDEASHCPDERESAGSDSPLGRNDEMAAPKPDEGATSEIRAGKTCAAGKKSPPEEKVYHYRIWYTKRGVTKYLSLLELQSVFERILRRCRVPVAFSGGFHPLPVMNFGRALPVGVESCAEWFNLGLREEIDPLRLLDMLRPEFLQGMRPIKIEALNSKREKGVSDAETFILKLCCDSRKKDAVMDKAMTLCQAKTIPLTLTSPKGDRQIDAAPFFRDVSTAGASSLKFTFSWKDSYANPLKMIKAIFPELNEAEFSLIKIRQWFYS